MFLSIVIPIYNDEKYLRECLDSCLNQDISYDEYEILCEDDGSTDGTKEILKEYEERYSNIKVYFNEHQKEHGRNIGQKQAQGDYIWFVDHDDLIKRNILAYFKQILSNDCVDRLVFSCYSFSDDENVQELLSNETNCPNSDFLVDSVVWNAIYRRKFLQDNNIMSKSVRFGNEICVSIDTFFVYECKYYNAKENYILGNPYYFYRKTPNSESRVYSLEAQERKIIGAINQAALHKEDYENLQINTGEFSGVISDYLMEFIRKALLMIALLPKKQRKIHINTMMQRGLFPFKQPKNCRYDFDYFYKEKNGMSKYLNICRYYSISKTGFFLLSLHYDFQKVVRNIRGALVSVIKRFR